MINIRSRINGSLLARYCNYAEHGPGDSGRLDFADPAEPLQVARLYTVRDKGFPAHRHLEKPESTTTAPAQEVWVVIRGKVIVSVYDFDGRIEQKITLSAGDCMIFFAGGHRFDVKAGTFWYELKSGPYLGRERDKVLLDDSDVPTDDNAG